MQLNEILEKNTISVICNTTNISEKYISALSEEDFGAINRVKAFGFISIIEREYKADLSALKEKALDYYNQHGDDERVTLGLPMLEEKKGKSKLFYIIVIGLIVYAVWFAFTHLDKDKLSEMLPFSEETLSKMIMPGQDDVNSDINNETNK
jgi:hypothetical protein